MPEDSSPRSISHTVFDDGLVHRESLRLQVRTIDALPQPLQLDQIHADNERFLKGLAAMEEHVEPAEDAEGLHPELMRLDLKVSLLMDLVGELLTRQAGLPDPGPVWFNGQGIGWLSIAPPARESLVALDLYLHPSLPRPLHLFGRVLALEDTGQGVEVTCAYLAMPDAERDLIEKFVFRAHRRQVARQRAQGPR